MAVTVRDIITFHRRFNSVQKAAILGVLSVISAIFLGNVVVFTSFVTSLALAVFTLRRLLTLKRHLPTDRLLPIIDRIEALYVTVYKALFDELPPKIAAKQIHVSGDPESEVKTYLQFVVRDFIQSWYDYLSSDRECTDEFREILDGIVLSMFERLKVVDVHELIQRLTYVVQRHLQDYYAAKYEWETLPHYRKRTNNAVEFKKYQTVVHVFRSQRKFHLAMESEEREVQYLRNIVDIIMKISVPSHVYNCYAARELLNEILVNKIMLQIVDMVSKPHWLHETLSKITMDEDPIRIDDDEKPDISQSDVPNDTMQDTGTVASQEYASVNSKDSTSEVVAPVLRRKRRKKGTTDRRTFVSHILDFDQPSSGLKRVNTAPAQISHLSHASNPTEEIDVRDYLRAQLHDSTDNRSSGTSATVSEDSADELDAPALVSRRRSDSFISENLSEVSAMPTTPSVSGDDQSMRFVWPSVEAAVHSQITNDPDESSLTSFDVGGDESDAASNVAVMGSDDAFVSQSSEPVSETQSSAMNILVRPPTPEVPSESVMSNSMFYIPNGDNVSLCSNSSGGSADIHNTHRKSSEEIQRGSPLSRNTSLDDHLRIVANESLHSDSETVRNEVGSNSVDIPQDGHQITCNSVGPPATHASQLRDAEQTTPTGNVFSPGIHVAQAQTICRSEGESENARRLSDSSGDLLNSYDDITQGEEVDEGTDAFSALEGDIHLPPKLLINQVEIPATDTMMERYNQKPFVLYDIKYLAWHLNDSSKSWTLRRDSVKRRFREFITLQERLEEHGMYKKFIKGIKGPKKWKFLPMRNITEKEVESRRLFLHRYLQDLVAINEINNSMAIREFLAYEGDTRIAFVKKAPEIPRIDKTIIRTVSGAWRKMTDVVMPDDTVEKKSSHKKAHHKAHHKHKSKKKMDMTNWRDADAISVEMEDELADVGRLERTLGKCVHATIEKYDSDYHDSSEEEVAEDEQSEFADALEGRFLQSGRQCTDDPAMSRTGNGMDNHKIPIASAILDAAVQTADDRSYWIVQEKSIRLVKIIIGKLLDTYLHEEIQDLVSEKRCTFYLHELREVLWPGGILDTNPVLDPSSDQKAVTRAQCRRCLLSFLPFYIPLFIGHGTFAECIDEVMACLDHYNLNRHLGFCLLDLLIEVIFPEINIREVQDELITGTRTRVDSMASST